MNWARGTALLALGTGVFLTICLSLALAALDVRLFSQWRRDVPPGLPGLALSLAFAAASFLFLGWRLRRSQKVRLATYQSAIGLVVVSALVLARNAAWLFQADRLGAGSLLLGMDGLVLGTVGGLIAAPARTALVEAEASPAETADLRAQVEELVDEIQRTYRQLPMPQRPLTTWQVVREGILRPARAFNEVSLRPHLELCWLVPLMVVLWPRLTVFARPTDTTGGLLLLGLDYGIWMVLYDLGKAAMFWGIARALGQPLRYASALAAFMIIDFPSLASYLVDYAWREQYAWVGMIPYSKLGLGPLVTGLAETQPWLFEVLAKVDVLHVWTFGLWWTAVAMLMNMGILVALLVTMVTFPASHLFAVLADAFVTLVRW
jgi:hypothetical protein